MDPRFVTKSMHAFLDYPVAISLIGAPFLLGLGSSHPLALWLAVGTGVAAFVLTVFTDHQLGVFRVLPYGFRERRKSYTEPWYAPRRIITCS
jgi:hypothetical protein